MCKKLSYFLAFLLCTQAISTELFANQVAIQQRIEDVETEKKMDQLLLLIQKRLAIMHEVARTKWNQNLAIEDKAREQQILKSLMEKSNQFGLDEKWIAKFFQAQIDASKEMQKRDFILWREQGIQKFENVFSLKDELRQYIDQINQEMLELLSKIDEKNHYQFVLDHPISSRVSDHIENDVWLLAISPFQN